MHELSVCNELLAQVRAIANGRGASGVGLITVRVGPLSGVEAELLERAFPLACGDRMTENAKLAIESMPVRVRCRECGNENEAAVNRLICSACESWRVDLTGGDELILARVELNGVPAKGDPAYV